MPLRARLRAALQEPLVHFLAAGLAIFVYFMWRGTDIDPASRTITITAEQANRLAESWAAAWQRQPSPAEIDGLVRDYIKEEIYTREALRLGLDKDDVIVRRRLRAKMEFLERSSAETVDPDENSLQQWFRDHYARYAPQVRRDFDQIYLGEDGQQANRLADTLKGRLASSGDWQGLGEPLAAPHSLVASDAETVAATFGEDFAQAISGLRAGQWNGPIPSGFGFHLVRIRKIHQPEKVRLRDVRQQVENDWRAATVTARMAKAYQTLLDGYTIRIEAR